MILGAHFLLLTFFENFNSKTTLFLTTFTQLNFLNGWLLVLGLKECLVECATLCVKSEVILTFVVHQVFHFQFLTSQSGNILEQPKTYCFQPKFNKYVIRRPYVRKADLFVLVSFLVVWQYFRVAKNLEFPAKIH